MVPGVAACLLMAVWTVGPLAAAATASDQVQTARALWTAPDLSTFNLTQVTSPFTPLAALHSTLRSAVLHPAPRSTRRTHLTTMHRHPQHYLWPALWSSNSPRGCVPFYCRDSCVDAHSKRHPSPCIITARCIRCGSRSSTPTIQAPRGL